VSFLDVINDQPIEMNDAEWAEFERGLKRMFASMQLDDEAFIMSLSLRDALLFTTDVKGSA
jgi:hypothetical protein